MTSALYAITIFSGMVAKVYDDFNDNERFLTFKENQLLMEVLKGLHYTAFTFVSITQPMFLYINYISTALHGLTSKHSFKDAYEKSLFYSFGFLSILLLALKGASFDGVCFDIILMISVCVGLYIEPILSKYFIESDAEVSVKKCWGRICMTLLATFYMYLATAESVRCLFAYLIGYGICSFIIQYYCVYRH